MIDNSNDKYNIGDNIFNAFFVKNFIGQGKSSKVYEVKNQIGLTSAIRVFDKNIKINENFIQKLIKFRSNRLISIENFGLTTKGDNCILMEYEKHNLNNFEYPIEEHLACRYFSGILKGLKILHDNSFIHTNIKPSNLFYSNMIKISDSGLYEYIVHKDNIKYDIYDLYFKPPEFFQNQKNNIYSDLWASCVLFYYMLTNKFPFYGKDKNQIYEAIINNNIDYDIIPETYRKFLLKCFQLDPYNRFANSKDLNDNFIKISKQTSPSKSKRTFRKRIKKIRSGCIGCL